MSQLTVTVLQLGLLALLWLFVLSVVGVLRRDLFGTRVAPRQAGGARPAARAREAVPVAASAPAAPQAPQPPAPPREPVPARLVVTEGPLTGAVLDLGRTPVLIGRAPECTLVLGDDYASSRHARLLPQEGRWVLEDLGSTNGTTLSRAGRGRGEPVTGSTGVGVGDVVRIGRTALELQR